MHGITSEAGTDQDDIRRPSALVSLDEFESVDGQAIGAKRRPTAGPASGLLRVTRAVSPTLIMAGVPARREIAIRSAVQQTRWRRLPPRTGSLMIPP